MTSLIEKKPDFHSSLAGYALAGALVFLLGFFIHYGQEAHASKSWQYIISSSDDVSYWSYAKGRMMTPRCDGNPFYYEDQGTRHIIPYTSAEAIGLISKYTRIPLSWFFPLWHILTPFLVWFAIFVCCWKLWNYPIGISATVSMLLLLSTLFFPWPIWPTLLRFSRPLDGIGLIFIWISLLFKGDPCNQKHGIAIAIASAVALWLQPFYAVFGLWITGVEYLRLLLKKIKFFEPSLHWYALGSTLISGLLFETFLLFGKNKNPTISNLEAPFSGNPFFTFSMSLLLLLFVASVVIFFVFSLKNKTTPLDRLVLEWLSFGVLIYAVFGSKKQMALHLFYFTPIMIFSLTGWIYEKIRLLKGSRYFLWLGKLVAVVAGILAVFFIINKENPFSSMGSMHYYVYISRYLFLLTAITWILLRFDSLRQAVMRREVICGIILFLTVLGYGRIPLYHANHNFPFDGAYQWMNGHAKKNEVVLIASFKYWHGDYLFLKTGLKSYLNGFGQDLSSKKTNEFRLYFVEGLLLNSLTKMPFYEKWSIDQLIHFLKLDYILVPMPSPFLESITSQLRGHLQIAYQDKRCLLWKVL